MLKNIKKNLKNQIKIKGQVVAVVCDVSSPEAKKMEKELLAKRGTPQFHDLLMKFNALFGVRKYVHNNLVTTVGREVLARLLSGDATYSGEINYGALGTDDTAVDNSDTTLGSESYRNQTASQTFANNIAYIDFYYEATECDGNYKEFGNFIDGTASADTGQLFSHVNVDWTKSNTESLTVSCIYTIT